MGVLGRWKTKRMSSSGCCVLMNRCLALSVSSNLPLVSTRIPLGSSKSTVYVRSMDGTTYLILTSSKITFAPRRWRDSAVAFSRPDLKPCLRPAARERLKRPHLLLMAMSIVEVVDRSDDGASQ